MILLLNNQPDIDLANQLSFSQAMKLTRSSVSEQELDRIYDGCTCADEYDVELEKIGASLDRLKVSIDTYSSAPILQKIKGVFDGTLIKMWVLRIVISTVTKAVKRQIWDLYALDELPQVQFVKSKFKFSIPSQSILDTKTNAIARKYTVVNAIHEEFLKANPEEAYWDETVAEVNAFFVGKLSTLSTGQDTPIPRFFHATGRSDKNSWKLIIQSKKIIQTPAVLGFGAYVSTGDESNHGYGPYTFGLTHHAVYRYKASYYNGTNIGKHHHLWARVEHDIELSPRTVSHFVCNDKATCRGAYEMFVTDLGFSVPVFSRAANEEIIRLFNQKITQRPLSRKWEKLRFASSGFPSVMKPYSFKIGRQFNKCFS